MMIGLFFRRSLISVAAVFLLLSLTACGQNADGTVEGGHQEISDADIQTMLDEMPEYTADEPLVTPEEIHHEGDRFADMIRSLDVDTLTKIELSQVNPSNGKEVRYSSDDRQTIEAWVTLLNQAETSPQPFEPLLGNGFAIRFYAGDKQVEIGGFLLPYIYNTTDQTMNVIENYADLIEKFNDAKKMISSEIF